MLYFSRLVKRDERVCKMSRIEYTHLPAWAWASSPDPTPETETLLATARELPDSGLLFSRFHAIR